MAAWKSPAPILMIAAGEPMLVMTVFVVAWIDAEEDHDVVVHHHPLSLFLISHVQQQQ